MELSLENILNEVDKIPGGLAKGKTLDDIAKKHNVDKNELEKQLEKGIKVESEHTKDDSIAKEIAMDHLFEDPKYYDKLSKIEEGTCGYNADAKTGKEFKTPGGIKMKKDPYGLSAFAIELVKEFNNDINEIGELSATPYKYTERSSDLELEGTELFGTTVYDFSAGDIFYDVIFEYDYDSELGKNIVKVDFTANESYEMTGANEPYKILSTIISIIKKELDRDIVKDNLDILLYMPAETKTKGSEAVRLRGINQRNELYKVFFKKNIPYVKMEETPNETRFYLKENQLNEAVRCKALYNTPQNELVPYIKSLTQFMDENIELRPLPKVKFVDDEANASKVLGKTAYYDPQNCAITLYITDRHPKDILRSFAHEMIHHMQNMQGRLGNIGTQNVNQDDNLKGLEEEAYQLGNILLRSWENSQSNSKKTKDSEYYQKYKQYALTELFEKDLPNIEKISPTKYIVNNGDDIEAEYFFKVEFDVFDENPTPNNWSINWRFTDNNKNISPEAWKQVTATSFKILNDFIKTKNPKSITIVGNTETKTNIYKSKSFLEKLKNIFNNKYKINNSNDDKIILHSIEESYQSSIKKRMETLNESYKQSLHYWQNGDINSKSKIERWNSIKKVIERKVIREMYKLDKTKKYYIFYDMDSVLVDFDKVEEVIIKPGNTGIALSLTSKEKEWIQDKIWNTDYTKSWYDHPSFGNPDEPIDYIIADEKSIKNDISYGFEEPEELEIFNSIHRKLKNKRYIFYRGHDPKIKKYPESYNLQDTIVGADIDDGIRVIYVIESNHVPGYPYETYGAFDKDNGEYLKYSDLDKIGKVDEIKVQPVKTGIGGKIFLNFLPDNPNIKTINDIYNEITISRSGKIIGIIKSKKLPFMFAEMYVNKNNEIIMDLEVNNNHPERYDVWVNELQRLNIPFEKNTPFIDSLNINKYFILNITQVQ